MAKPTAKALLFCGVFDCVLNVDVSGARDRELCIHMDTVFIRSPSHEESQEVGWLQETCVTIYRVAAYVCRYRGVDVVNVTATYTVFVSISQPPQKT